MFCNVEAVSEVIYLTQPTWCRKSIELIFPPEGRPVLPTPPLKQVLEMQVTWFGGFWVTNLRLGLFTYSILSSAFLPFFSRLWNESQAPRYDKLSVTDYL